MKKSSKQWRIRWEDNAVSSKESVQPSGPLREYRAKFEKVRKGKKAVPDPDKLGMRSKLGGTPDWIQHPEVPRCGECKESMTFVAQIDSIEHDEAYNPNAIGCLSGKQQYMFGDVGMIYVFLCIECSRAKAVVQCG